MIKQQIKIVPPISYLTEQIIIKPKNHNYKALLGKRKFRGLFISSTKQAINADVNGAIGIARKVFDESVKQIIDSGVVLTPIKKLVV